MAVMPPLIVRLIRGPAIEAAALIGGEIPMQVLPPTWSNERQHELTKECWCRPTIEVRMTHHSRKDPEETATLDDDWDRRIDAGGRHSNHPRFGKD